MTRSACAATTPLDEQHAKPTSASSLSISGRPLDFFDLLGPLHDSGLPLTASASVFWEDGFTVRLRNTDNGECVESRCADLVAAAGWVIATVRERFPASAFTEAIAGAAPGPAQQAAASTLPDKKPAAANRTGTRRNSERYPASAG